MKKDNRITIRFEDQNFDNLRKLSYVSRKSLNSLVNEAVKILCKTPAQSKKLKEKV